MIFPFSSGKVFRRAIHERLESVCCQPASKQHYIKVNVKDKPGRFSVGGGSFAGCVCAGCEGAGSVCDGGLPRADGAAAWSPPQLNGNVNDRSELFFLRARFVSIFRFW